MNDENSRVRVGDRVLVPSTDYRDIRKAAFQQYAVATHFNAARIPSGSGLHASASLGVAFVASVLALGVSLGLDFTRTRCPGPNLQDTVGGLDVDGIPPDIRGECFASSDERERLKQGDWIAIWGGEFSLTGLTLADESSIYDNRIHHAPTCQTCRVTCHLCCGHCSPRVTTPPSRRRRACGSTGYGAGGGYHPGCHRGKAAVCGGYCRSGDGGVIRTDAG